MLLHNLYQDAFRLSINNHLSLLTFQRLRVLANLFWRSVNPAIAFLLSIDSRLAVSFLLFFFRSISFNNPSSLRLTLSFLPTRDKSAPCCDSIARFFRVNLTAGINQCDSSSVISKESPDIYALKDPSIRGRHIGSHLWLFLCMCVRVYTSVCLCACSPPRKTLVMHHRAFYKKLQERSL